MFDDYLSISVLAYLFSVSLQIAGALLLLIYSISTKREAVIRRFVGRGLLARQGEKLDYDENAYKEEFCRAYLNKFSFGYIAFGYLLGVVDKSSEVGVWELIIGIFLLAFFVMFFTIKGVNFFVEHSRNVNRKIENEDLLKLGVKPDIDYMTSDEVDQLWNDAWNSAKDSPKSSKTVNGK